MIRREVVSISSAKDVVDRAKERGWLVSQWTRLAFRDRQILADSTWPTPMPHRETKAEKAPVVTSQRGNRSDNKDDTASAFACSGRAPILGIVLLAMGFRPT